MRYSYREEFVVGSKGDAAGLILVAVLVLMDAALSIWGLVSLLIKGESAILDGILIPLLITAVIGASVWYSIRKRRRKALAVRRKAMAEGVRCAGRIINAGTDSETEEFDWVNENNDSETYRRKVANHWIDAAYTDARSGAVKRCRASYMIRSMKQLVGCFVDVYVWYEWSEYSRMYIMKTYVDACAAHQGPFMG